jgi:hypothetical protein
MTQIDAYRAMASTGQVSTQVPQSVQAASSVIFAVSSTSMIPDGQASTQALQAIQSPWLITAVIGQSPLNRRFSSPTKYRELK